MRPRYVYKDMLDKVISTIACVSMNHQNQLEQRHMGPWSLHAWPPDPAGTATNLGAQATAASQDVGDGAYHARPELLAGAI
jgi:hypothetical protein